MQNRGLLATLVIVLVLAVAGAAALVVYWRGDHAGSGPAVSLARALGDVEALAEKFPPPGNEPLAWPRDHGTKREQFVESWLFAGLVRDDAGREYGFQLALERVAVQGPAEANRRESDWALRNVYRGRLAIEPAGDPVRVEERLSRTALGLAGADTAPIRSWLEDWDFTVDEDGGAFVLRGAVADAALALRLAMPDTAPIAVDGELYRGYWWPGLSVSGDLELAGQSHAVTGRAMLDRLWGRGLPVGSGQLALARLWLEAGEGAAIRCEQLRRRAGGGIPLMECLAQPAALADELELEPQQDGWRVVDGVRYPLRWVLHAGTRDQAWRLEPLAADHPASLDGRWTGIVGGAAAEPTWGLLELSNFAAQ